MNRNTERILFTTIGVLIVMFGYILGNFYSATQAQKDDFPTYENLFSNRYISCWKSFKAPC